MTTLTLFAQDFSGSPGLNAFLRRSDTGALINAGGDALTESPAGSGRFEIVVSESIPAVVSAVGVYSGAESPDNLLLSGWLQSGATMITEDFPQSGSSGGSGDASQSTLLAVQTALARVESQTSKLSGTPVTVNGNVKPGGQIVLKHGDNHTVALGNSIAVPVDDVAGALHTLMAAVGVGNISIAAIRGADPASRIVGTVAALNYASNVLTVTFEFASAETSKGIVGPVYTYDVYRTDNPTRTFFSGKLTVSRDARA